jgi:Fic family protein
MIWNWQQRAWPKFRWQAKAMEGLEMAWLAGSNQAWGSLRHQDEAERLGVAIELMCAEALRSSEIEGEILERASVQSSIRKQFGLATDKGKSRPAEQGMAELLADLHRHYAAPVDRASICAWQAMVVKGRKDLKAVGAYRRHVEPMQIISGPIHAPAIHFEAPPSGAVPSMMAEFIAWFNQTHTDPGKHLPALTRAGLAHLHFVSIHPFEDGNGRIARALAEKALAQALGRPTLLALSQSIQAHRKEYYQVLETNNQGLEVSAWLQYFGEAVLDAQVRAQRTIDHIIKKTQLFDRLRDKINERQSKALARMFKEGPDGFKDGMNASKYCTITGASPATATRDLQRLVELGVFKRSGELKHTRYSLALSPATNTNP